MPPRKKFSAASAADYLGDTPAPSDVIVHHFAGRVQWLDALARQEWERTMFGVRAPHPRRRTRRYDA